MNELMEGNWEVKRPKIVVMGDVMLDAFEQYPTEPLIDGGGLKMKSSGKDCWWRLGGAGNVAANLRSMGCEVTLIGAVGENSEASARLSKMCHEAGIVPCLAAIVPGTTVKKRLVYEDEMGELRCPIRIDDDHVTKHPERAVMCVNGDLLEGVDAVVISDYEKGMVTKQSLVELRERTPYADGVKFVIGDLKPAAIESLGKMCDVLKCNAREAAAYLGGTSNGLESACRMAKMIYQNCALDRAYVTTHEGIASNKRIVCNPRWSDSKWKPEDGVNYVGCGDSVLAALTVGMVLAAREKQPFDEDEWMALAMNAARVAILKGPCYAVTYGEMVVGTRDLEAVK